MAEQNKTADKTEADEVELLDTILAEEKDDANAERDDNADCY